MRSRQLRLQWSGLGFVIGSFNTRYGEGITVGTGRALHKFSHFDELLKSALYPKMSRENGISMKRSARRFHLQSFISRVEGDTCYRTSAGLNLSATSGRLSPGWTYMIQQIGQTRGAKITNHYLAPHFDFETSRQSHISGESSFQVNKSAAHFYRLFMEGAESFYEFTVFSYARTIKMSSREAMLTMTMAR